MLQRCRLSWPARYLRFTSDMDIQDLVEFVGDEGTVCINSGGVALAFGGPYSVEDVVELEDDDVVMYMAGDIEVYDPHTFAKYFKDV